VSTILKDYIMPTGYTHDIKNGITFEDYAFKCALAFGACLPQRDESANERPKLREESSLYEEKLPEALAEYGYLMSLNNKQQNEYGTEERDKEIANIQASLEKKRDLESKYRNMLNKVEAWPPPTNNHVSLKGFMIKQIAESIEFDCNTNHYIEELQKAITKKPADFYADAVKKAEWNCNYYEEELEKDLKRTEESNAWIMDLYKSLGIEYD